MKILVTGANGFLGQGIVKKLLDFGNDVVATDFSTEHIDIRAEKIQCDLFSIDNPYTFFKHPEVLLHLAWRDGFVHYSDAHIRDLPAHYKFIKDMAESDVKKISVMGSMHEVGFYEGCIREDTPCNPTTPYGISKNALRNLTRMICEQKSKEFQWLRGFYIVGNSLSGSSIFSKIAKAESEGETFFPFTMGQNQFDFIDYNEFCAQVAKKVNQSQVLDVINICSGRPEKLADRVEKYIKDNGYKIKLQYGAFPDRPYDSKAIWGDDEKIRIICEPELPEKLTLTDWKGPYQCRKC